MHAAFSFFVLAGQLAGDPAAASSGSQAASTAYERQVKAAGLKRVHVVGGRGDITVRSAVPPRATVNGTVGGGCSIDTQVDAGTLTVRVSAPQCEAALRIDVPAHVDCAIESAQGNVFVAGLRGALAVTLGAGNAVVGGKLTQLTAQLDQGSLSATGLLGDTTLRMQHGHTQLYYEKLPRDVRVNLAVTFGHVTVTLPPCQADVTATLAAGTVQNALAGSISGRHISFEGAIDRGNLVLRAVSTR